MSEKIVITSAIRTAVGSFNKSLKNIPGDELGAVVISENIKKSKLKNNEIDEVIMGQVLTGGAGQNPARQAAIKSGIPKEKPAFVVNQVCGSGLRSIASAFQSIKSGDSKIIIAGGQENMSLAPHAINLRNGKKLGHSKIEDGLLIDGLTDVYDNVHMGVCAEKCATEMNFSREKQDAFAIESYNRSTTAWQSGKFTNEIIPIEIPQRKGFTVRRRCRT